jgi:hypothetical protein
VRTPCSWARSRELGSKDPKSSGVPTEWETTNNVAWRIDVPGLGWSSPIVWGNRVFLTTAVDAQGTEQPEEGFYLGKDRGGRGEHRWLVLACDLNTGVKLWERQVHQAVPPRTHLKSSYASATPVTDGERVYAWFGEFGLLVALNVADGAQVWSFSEPPRKSRNNWGFGASPVMHGGRVYLVHHETPVTLSPHQSNPPINQSGNRMRLWKSTFGKSLPRACVAGVLVSAVLALLAGGTGQVLAADFYVGGDGASDRNPGTASQPFATIQKAAAWRRPATSSTSALASTGRRSCPPTPARQANRSRFSRMETPRSR